MEKCATSASVWIGTASTSTINAASMTLIQSGATLGLFQIESSGMQDLNKRLKPSSFEDLIAVLALYRPGPMESGMLDDFYRAQTRRAKRSFIPLKRLALIC
jgi:DNA polymerase III alpha subunit